MTDKEKTIEDLLGDEYFHKLLIDPDRECEEFWSQWKNENSSRAECISTAKELLLAPDFLNHTIDSTKKSAMWVNVSKQLDKNPHYTTKKTRHTPLRVFYGIAASLVFLIVSFYAYQFVVKTAQSTKDNLTQVIEIVVPRGKLSKIQLEDGSTVRLFAGSRISYPEQFEPHKREVFIEGEAFFEVSRDTDRPFIVRTKTLLTTALGTSFNVRTFHDSDMCEVSLVTGKVKVEKVDKSLATLNELILTPGEEAFYKGGYVVMQPFDIDDKIGWKDGDIILENKNFDESIEILKRWYDVDFIVENKHKETNQLGSGRFKNQSLENILVAIGYTFDFNFQIDGDQITITFK